MKYQNNLATLVALFITFFALEASAKQQNIPYGVDSMVIEGKILDDIITTMPSNETNVYLHISKFPFSRLLFQNAEHITLKLKAKNNNTFKFVIPIVADRFYMSIYYGRGLGQNSFSDLTNIYILEKGDKIKCILTKEFFKFSGLGSAKLNCQSELNKASRPLKSWSKLYNAEKFDQLALEENNLLDSCLKAQKMIIERYRPIINKEVADILLANCYGMRYFGQLWNYRNQAYNVGGKFYRAYVKSIGFKNIDKTNLDINDNLLVQAPIYTDFLFEKIMMQTRLNIDGEIEANTSPQHMKRTFDFINQDYNGILREKLIATFFVQWQTVPTIMDYYENSLFILENSKYRSIIVSIADKNLKGRLFYPFSLENIEGKVVNLRDLNDKVVIIDFWYTGCAGCIILKRAMEGVWETYKKSPKVSFVSISIDKNKETWRKSVISELYTDPSAINLYTGGEGKDHPLIKNLEITAYPRMYMLKDGKLYSANIPWPSGPDTTKGETKEFIDLIAKAINAK